MSDLTRRIAGLPPEKREQLLRKLRQKEKKGVELRRRTAEERAQPCPLSFQQQRLWWLDRLTPGSPLYNNPAGFVLRGRLDAAALERSFHALVARHSILRTVFYEEDGEARQRTFDFAGPPLVQVDLSHLPAAERRSRVEALAHQEAVQPFDLETGPLLATELLRLDEEEHVLLLTMHHIVSDGWSFGIILRELSCFYTAEVAGGEPGLDPLPLDYADYAWWQRRWLAGEELERQLAYWRETLGGEVPVLELPTDRPRPALQSYAGARHRFTFPGELRERLRQLAQKRRATLFMVLLTGLATLLSRHAEQRDVILGTSIANRNRRELEELVGFFVNTLVIRTDLGGTPTFEEAVERVRRVSLGAFAHQDLPFEALVDALELRRDLSRTPLFQVMFVLQNTPEGDLTLPGLTLRPQEVETDTAKFDLTLTLMEGRDALGGELEYNTDLFDATTAARLIEHLRCLLEGAVADPTTRLDHLPLVTAAERHQLILGWNDTAAEYDRRVLIHQLFERRAADDPDATALVFNGADFNGAGSDDTTVSYGELNRRANRLAHHLVALGVGPEVLVAVFLDRSPEMVVAVLAVLKAGGAYVPFEISLPTARIDLILSRHDVRHLLTEGALLERVAELGSEALREVVVLDGDAPPAPDTATPWREHRRVTGRDALASRPGTDPPARAVSRNRAYVIFTSGSTGEPKGVVVRHSPVINLIEWIAATHGMGPGDRVLFITSLSFDLSVYDVFGLLAAGGSIHVARRDEIRDPERLLELLLTEPITFWDSAPAALQQLVPFLPDRAQDAALRLVYVSGDWVPLTLPDALAVPFPEARLIALGGATEATVWSNYFPVRRVLPEWASIPYGRPIQNARYYVLDASLEPCPIGVPGDLHIADECLAAGYDTPGLSAASFLPDPYRPVPGAYMYATGDRARFFADGKIEFLGRRDSQVKLRGFRIELGEIQAVLNQHPRVQEAVVMVREDVPGNRQLVAYVVLVAGESETPELAGDLHGQVAAHLPEYMIPAAFVVLDAMPLTANRKVDRKALPAPDRGSTAEDESYEAPRNAAEETLAGIWCQVLGLERVGVFDDFFEIGGDSILSLQIITRATAAGLKLTAPLFFTHPTVAELAALAEPVATAADSAPVSDVGRIPLTPVQRWFFDGGLEPPDHFNQAMMVRLDPRIDPDTLARALDDVVARHAILRARYARSEEASGDATWIQEVPETAEPAADRLRLFDLHGVPAAERSAAIESHAGELHRDLDLARGRVLCAGRFDLGDDGRRLLLVAHHLVIDGVSWRIVLEDLEAACRQRLASEAVALPAPPTPFRAWAESLERHAADPRLADEELDHWLATADGAEPLPVDHPGGENTLASLDSVTVGLDAEETQALLGEVPKVYNTKIDEVLLTALVEATAAWTGKRLLHLTLEGHGRESVFEELDLSRTVGWLTAMYPVRLDLRRHLRPGEALQETKEQLRRIPRRGLGYGLLRYLGDDDVRRRLASLPAPQLSFNYLGQFGRGGGAAAEGGDGAARPGWMTLAGDPIGETQPADGPRRDVIEIVSMVTGGTLTANFGYSTHLHRRTTLEGLARGFADALRRILEHCRSPEAGGYTPSDFRAEIDRKELDKLLGQERGSRRGSRRRRSGRRSSRRSREP